jgi:phenylpropionate dioxygenase-like ring-hydroxylating dioxygenase large terminal subunit
MMLGGEMSDMRADSGDLANYWYAVATSDQIAKKRPLGRTVMEQMLVLWRTSDGKVVCFDDHCLHRRALLSEGAVFDDMLGCPYHGWTYDRRGTCVGVPSEGKDGPTAGKHQLRTWHTREAYDLVWVWMGDEEPSREVFPMPGFWGQKGWRRYYMETMFDNGVTNLVENFMDVPHTVFVHDTWFRKTSWKAVPSTVERTTDSVLVTYDHPSDSIGVQGRILNPKNLPLEHTDKFYMPNNTRVDYVWGDCERSFVITSTCTPISPFETRVFTLISYKLGRLNHLARWWMPWYTRQVIQQDVVIMANQGKSLRHLGETTFNNTEADLLHIEIEALRDAARRAESPPKPRTGQMTFYI